MAAALVGAGSLQRLPRRWAAVLLLLGPWLFPSAARAATLELRGPERCSDRDELAFRVSRLLESPIEAVPALGFRVDITAAARGYTARLQVTDAEHPGSPSERHLEEQSCSRLLDALGVVIVLTVHRLQEGRPAQAPEPARVEQTAAGPESPGLGTTPAEVSRDRSTPGESDSGMRVAVAITAWVLGDVGALPAPSIGAGLSADATLGPRLRLLAAGVLFPDRHVALEGGATPAPGADVGLALGALSACYAPASDWRSAFAVGGCVRGELGRLWATGTDVRGARSASRAWIAAGADVLASLRLAPALRLQAQMGATAPLVRTEFALGELGGLYRPAPLTLRAALGLGVELD